MKTTAGKICITVVQALTQSDFALFCTFRALQDRSLACQKVESYSGFSHLIYDCNRFNQSLNTGSQSNLPNQ